MNSSNPIYKKSLSLIWLCIFLFALALAAPWFNLSISNHTFVKSYVSFFGSGILFLSILYLNKNESINNLNFNSVSASSLAIFLLGLLSLFWSANLDFSITKLFLWLSVLFSFVIGSNLRINLNELKKIAWIFLLTASIISTIGLLQYYFQPFNLVEAVSPGSTFGNKNVANQVLILLIPFSFFLLLLNQQNKSLPWLISILLSGNILFIFLTDNRSILLGIGIQFLFLIFFLIFQTKKESKFIEWNLNKTIAVLFGAALVFIFVKTPNLELLNYSEIANNPVSTIEPNLIDTKNEKEISQASRFHIWSAAIEMIKNKPFFGSGLGSFAHNIGNEGYTSYQVKGFQRAHNDFLEIAVEMGILGFVLLTTLAISIISSIRRIYKNSSNEISLFYFMVFISLSGSFINAQFSFPYQQAMPLVLFGLFIGMINNQYSKVSGPLINIKININNSVRKILFAFYLTIILSISYIYLGWINTYNTWNQNNINHNYNDLSFLETPIYHSGIFSLLSRTSANYSRNGDFKKSIQIDKFIHEYWPNHIQSLFRLGYSFQQIGQNKEALEFANELKKIEPDGLYGSYIIKILAEISENNFEEFHNTFDELYSKSENLLSVDTNTYHYLLFFTLHSKKLTTLAPIIYEKYSKHHGYSCEVENNIAIHYFNLEDFEKSASHVKKAFKNNSKCLNPLLIDYLEEKQLL